MRTNIFLSLCLSVLLALGSSCQATVALSTTHTAQLMAQTSEDILQAYDLLEQLKQRTTALESTAQEQMGGTNRLPRNLDAIRSRILKARLIRVLSATPFSNPEKHLADCADARVALQEYMTHLKKVLDKKKASSTATQAPEEDAQVLAENTEPIDEMDSAEEETTVQDESIMQDEPADFDDDTVEENDISDNTQSLPFTTEPRGATLSSAPPVAETAKEDNDDIAPEMPEPLPLPGDDMSSSEPTKDSPDDSDEKVPAGDAKTKEAAMPPPLPLPEVDSSNTASTQDTNIKEIPAKAKDNDAAMPPPEPLPDKTELKDKKKARNDELPELPI